MDSELLFEGFFETGFHTRWIIAQLAEVMIRKNTFGFEEVGIEVNFRFDITTYFGFTPDDRFEKNVYFHRYNLRYDEDLSYSYFGKIMKNIAFNFLDLGDSLDLKNLEDTWFLIGLQDNVSARTQNRFTNIDSIFPLTEDFFKVIQEFEIEDEDE